MDVAYDKLVEKWAPVLNEESAGSIKDAHRKAVTAAILLVFVSVSVVYLSVIEWRDRRRQKR